MTLRFLPGFLAASLCAATIVSADNVVIFRKSQGLVTVSRGGAESLSAPKLCTTAVARPVLATPPSDQPAVSPLRSEIISDLRVMGYPQEDPVTALAAFRADRHCAVAARFDSITLDAVRSGMAERLAEQDAEKARILAFEQWRWLIPAGGALVLLAAAVAAVQIRMHLHRRELKELNREIGGGATHDS